MKTPEMLEGLLFFFFQKKKFLPFFCVCLFLFVHHVWINSLDKKSLEVGTGLVGAPACGDVMKLQIQVPLQIKMREFFSPLFPDLFFCLSFFSQVDIDTQTITDTKFKTFGCGSAIASSSLVTEMIKGKTIGITQIFFPFSFPFFSTNILIFHSSFKR